MALSIGTNRQAIDLVGRKLAGDDGAAMRALIAEAMATARIFLSLEDTTPSSQKTRFTTRTVTSLSWFFANSSIILRAITR
jgi:hypothetical protein